MTLKLAPTLLNPPARILALASETTTQHLAASVTDRTQWYTFGTSSTGTTGRTTRTYYVTAVDCADLTFWWAGSYGDESTVLGNAFTLKAVLEAVPSGAQSASGTLYSITFAGLSSVTINPGQVVRSDPLPVNLPKGTGFYVRVYCSVVTSATMNFPLGRAHNPNLFESNVVSADNTASTGTWTGNNSFSCGPVRIDGTTSSRLPAVVMIGSSTFEGFKDIEDTTTPGGGQYGWGWIRRLCNGANGLIHVAKSGETAQAFTLDHYRARGPMWSGCEYAIEGYGANDVTNGRTLAQIQVDKLRIWTAMANRRIQVWTPTLHPNLTTSTDSFATTGNQTPAATNSVRTGLNDWIRGGAPIDATTKAAVAVGTSGALLNGQSGHPLAGWLEVADVIETTRGSGIYKVGYTTDGQHMTSAAASAVAAALTSPFI
jgi:hypothetical protein